MGPDSAPMGGAGIGSVGSATRSTEPKGLIDFAAQDVSKVLGANIVLSEDVTAHLEPEPDAGRVVGRPRIQHRCMVGGRLREHRVQIRRRDEVRVGDFDLPDAVAAATDALQRLIEETTDVRLEPNRRRSRAARRW